MSIKRLLRPQPHLDRHPAQHALLVGIGAALALGAAVGISWAAGFANVLHELRHLDPIWLWSWRDGLDEVLNTSYYICNLLDRHPVIVFTR